MLACVIRHSGDFGYNGFIRPVLGSFDDFDIEVFAERPCHLLGDGEQQVDTG